MDNLKKTITTRLKQAREEARLTQNELADLLGIAKSTYTHLETGRNWVTVRRLAKIKQVLGRSADFFFGEDEPNNDDEATLLQLYRSISDKSLRKLAIKFLRLLIEQQTTENKKE